LLREGEPVVSDAGGLGGVLLRFLRLCFRVVALETLVDPVAGSLVPEPVLAESKISGSVFPRP
jgi:hypothetical protein